jgi:hypothetical protein
MLGKIKEILGLSIRPATVNCTECKSMINLLSTSVKRLELEVSDFREAVRARKMAPKKESK